MYLVMGAAGLGTASCVKTDSGSDLKITGGLKSVSGRIAIPPKRPASALCEFRRLLARNVASSQQGAASNAARIEAFDRALLSSLEAMPLHRSDVHRVLREAMAQKIQCGVLSCSQLFDVPKQGVAPILERARLIVLKDLDQLPEEHDERLFRLLGSFVDEAAADTASPLVKAIVVGAPAPRVYPIADSAVPTVEFLRDKLSEEESYGLAQYSTNYDISTAVRVESAVPLPGKNKVTHPFGTGMDIEYPSDAVYSSMKTAFKKMQPIQGTVYRGVARAPVALIDDLRARAEQQATTGLFYEGQAAITASSRDAELANTWIERKVDLEAIHLGFDPGKGAEPLIYVINQKSGYGIENVTSEAMSFLMGRPFSVKSMKEIVLPPISTYRVVRFEDRSNPELTAPDPRWPKAKYIVYLEEK